MTDHRRDPFEQGGPPGRQAAPPLPTIAPVIERLRRSPRSNWILTGAINSGKSTLLRRIFEEAKHARPPWRVGGIVSAGQFFGGVKVAYVAIDCLGSGSFLLAQRSPMTAAAQEHLDEMFGAASRQATGQQIGPWLIMEEGLSRATELIGQAVRSRCDLVAVDEFGLLEFEGRGLREAVDSAVASGVPVLLVVREELVERVRRLYGAFETIRVEAFGGPVSDGR